jgi:hypothetical protein
MQDVQVIFARLLKGNEEADFSGCPARLVEIDNNSLQRLQ